MITTIPNEIELYEKLWEFLKKGEGIIEGDCNTRTSVNTDVVTVDKHDDDIMIPVDNLAQNIQNINSNDNVETPQRGNELLQLCNHWDIKY